ncbi:MAG: 50S ribosomal protein L13 [Candidatus Alcyoniella australis]|nr:50S ribosomal protein L13 [Candidatus Alcyoniella australis]
MKTYNAKPGEVERIWYLLDAQDLVLGRISTRIADVLRGKHKPQYTPHVDTGDFVVVINAEKVKLTGNKLEDKKYYRHTGYIGGLKYRTAEQMLEEKPTEVLKHSVKGMLPKSSLGRTMFKKLKVYAGPEHPHEAQLPRKLEI